MSTLPTLSSLLFLYLLHLFLLFTSSILLLSSCYTYVFNYISNITPFLYNLCYVYSKCCANIKSSAMRCDSISHYMTVVLLFCNCCVYCANRCSSADQRDGSSSRYYFATSFFRYATSDIN